MFADKLSDVEKQSLVQLLTYVARSDGKLAKQEWHLLNRFCDDNGLVYDMNEECDLDDVCRRFRSKQTKVIALQHVIKMAVADGKYDDNERQSSAEIANRLSMEVDEFQQVERWVLEGVEWVKKGEAMIANA